MAKKSANPARKKYVFRKHANIGAADAIEDRKFLEQSFVDKGELEILKDNSRPDCIILGRTGTGKTALLEMLNKSEERVIQIVPDNLALSFISNNNVLHFYMAAGVDLDLFFRLLWRHVFAIEIIKERFQIINEESRDNFLVQIKDKVFNNKSKKEAIDYLVEWGESFWEETDYRVREITQTLEKDLSASVEGQIDGIIPPMAKGKVNLNAAVAKKLTVEQKAEIKRLGQDVINQVQIRVLNEIIGILESDILDDRQKKYYITIDRLDENWINEELRYHLIRALLETIREFNYKLSNVKIIAAVREDLLDRVFRFTRNPGYQEEKYSSMYLSLHWTKDEIIELLDNRVNQLMQNQYTNVTVFARDVLPSKISRANTMNYIIARTLYRPRDAIMFFNECIRASENKAINKDMVLKAEAIYSQARLRAIGDEWAADYPNLLDLVLFLKGFPRSFQLIQVQDKISSCMLEYLIDKEDAESDKKDIIFYRIEEDFYSNDIDQFMNWMMKILYRVGVVGVKLSNKKSTNWSFSNSKLLVKKFDNDSHICIHEAFWETLNIIV